MEAIGQYLLSVSGVAIISAIVLRLLEGKGVDASLVKMLCGIFMALTVISPFTEVRLSDLTNLLPDISAEAEAAVADGELTGKNALAARICEQLEAYILDKAARMDVSLTVEVELTQDAIPLPKTIRLSGNISPYAKSKLQSIIEDDLGIDKENQLWT